MFSQLSERLNHTIKKIRGQGRLSEENISDALREVRIALLEADVALPVVKDFIEHVRERALGQEVTSSLNPGQALVKIVRDELTQIMGEADAPLNLNVTPPAIILLAGLQGSGKTTTAAKLAYWLKTREKKKVLLASTDIYRPAAIEQLQKLAAQIEVEFMPSAINQAPTEIAHLAAQQARKTYADVLILDTAGRMHIDDAMMTEIKNIHAEITPIETLFVVDSMTGQDAVNTAKAFHDTVPLTGIILTKTDGDARGGAALSTYQTIKQPIKFMGIGEKIDALELFHPDRVASSILGMGDILTLVEEAERKADEKKTKKLTTKLRKGKHFDLEDFRDQMQQFNQLGGMASIMKKMPNMGALSSQAQTQVEEKTSDKLLAIIDSMTPQERHFPKVINGSRKRRIAQGSGNQIQAVNRLLKQFTQLQKMMKKFNKPGAMKKMMRNMQGKMPDGIL